MEANSVLPLASFCEALLRCVKMKACSPRESSCCATVCTSSLIDEDLNHKRAPPTISSSPSTAFTVMPTSNVLCSSDSRKCFIAAFFTGALLELRSFKLTTPLFYSPSSHRLAPIQNKRERLVPRALRQDARIPPRDFVLKSQRDAWSSRGDVRFHRGGLGRLVLSRRPEACRLPESLRPAIRYRRSGQHLLPHTFCLLRETLVRTNPEKLRLLFEN